MQRLTCTSNCHIDSGTEEVGLAAMKGWQWTPDMQQGVQWNLGGGQAGEAGPHPGSLEGVDSLPEAMAKSRKSASRRVSRSNSKQFERLTSQVTSETHSCKLATCRTCCAQILSLVALLTAAHAIYHLPVICVATHASLAALALAPPSCRRLSA